MALFDEPPVMDPHLALAAVQGTYWTIEHQVCAKAAVGAVLSQELGPSDDDGLLTLYDLVPEEWCAPDRSAATKLLAENIAFAVLDAWMRAVRQEISSPAGQQSTEHLRNRAIVAAEYRLHCSPHEWTDEDSEAMARYIIALHGPATSRMPSPSVGRDGL